MPSSFYESLSNDKITDHMRNFVTILIDCIDIVFIMKILMGIKIMRIH